MAVAVGKASTWSCGMTPFQIEGTAWKMGYIDQNQRNNNSQKDEQRNIRDCVGAKETEVQNGNNVEELRGGSQEGKVWI